MKNGEMLIELATRIARLESVMELMQSGCVQVDVTATDGTRYERARVNAPDEVREAVERQIRTQVEEYKRAMVDIIDRLPLTGGHYGGMVSRPLNKKRQQQGG